jgi:hypothetical protein
MGSGSKPAKRGQNSQDPIERVATELAAGKTADAVDSAWRQYAVYLFGSAGPVAPFFSQETWAFVAAIIMPVTAIGYATARWLPVLCRRSLSIRAALIVLSLYVIALFPVALVLNRRDVEHRERIGYSADKLPLLGEFASRGASNTDEQFRDLCLTAIEPMLRGKDRWADDIRIELWVYDVPSQRLIAINSHFLYNLTSDAVKRHFDVSPTSTDQERGAAGKCFMSKSRKALNIPNARDARYGARIFNDKADRDLSPNASLLAANVFAPGTDDVVGVLTFASPRESVFTPDDERIVLFVASTLQSFVADRAAKLAATP